MRFAGWHWLDDGLIPLLVVVIRVCWIAPWLVMLRRWLTPTAPAAWMPLWAVLLLLGGGLLLTQAVTGQGRSLRWARLWVTGAGLGGLLLLVWWLFAAATYALTDARWLVAMGYAVSDWREAIPPVALTLLVGAWLWLRGVKDGRQRLTRDDVWHAVTAGLVALALLTVVGQLDPAGPPPGTERWLLTLVAVSLAALAFASVELARYVGSGRGATSAARRLNRDWVVSVLVVTAILLLIGVAVGALVTPGTVAAAYAWVGVLLDWLGTVVGYVALALVYVLFLVLEPLYEWIRGQLADAPPGRPLTLGDLQRQIDELTGGPTTTLDPTAAESLRWLGVVGALVVVGMIFWWALRFFRRDVGRDPDETRETILTRALLQEQLAAAARGLLARLRRRTPQPELVPYLSLTDEEEPRRRVRALYQGLLARMAQLDAARVPGQTAQAYAAWRAARWPRLPGPTLAAIYAAARYGAEPPTAAQVEEMAQAWAQTEAALAAEPPPSSDSA
jgi:hypothetical protein